MRIGTNAQAKGGVVIIIISHHNPNKKKACMPHSNARANSLHTKHRRNSCAVPPSALLYVGKNRSQEVF